MNVRPNPNFRVVPVSDPRARHPDEGAVRAPLQRQIAAVEILPVPARRVASVDALRGFSMFWILGADSLARALDQMLSHQGAILSAVGGFIGAQLTHVEWEGARFYDLIFPMFIFVTGVSIVFSLTRLVEQEGMPAAHWRVLRRSALLFALGIIAYGGISQTWADIRVGGVLQRIALCYLFASLLFLNLSLRGMVIAFVSLLGGYWALMTFVLVPGIGAGSFAKDANLADWIDFYYMPGRLWEKTRDPEGLLSTLPAIGTCLLGVFAGLLLKDRRVEAQQKSLWLMAAGIAMMAAGWLWGLQFPVIKAIWTSSFVLVAGGFAILMLGLFHQFIDVWGRKKWAEVFMWVGANAIALYVFNMLVGFYPIAMRLVGGDVARFADAYVTPGAGWFLGAAMSLALVIAAARFLYRRKIFLRV